MKDGRILIVVQRGPDGAAYRLLLEIEWPEAWFEEVLSDDPAVIEHFSAHPEEVAARLLPKLPDVLKMAGVAIRRRRETDRRGPKL